MSHLHARPKRKTTAAFDKAAGRTDHFTAI